MRSRFVSEGDYRNIYAIGDIHGMAGNLEELLDIIPYDPAEDRLVFLGDYVDRGPESRRVIEMLWRLRSKTENVVFLMGNHEQMFLDFLNGADPLHYFWNCGKATLESYGFREVDYGRYEVFLPDEHR